MKNNLLKLKLCGVFLLKQLFPSFIFSWEKQTRPVWMMFIIIMNLEDLFLFCQNSSTSYNLLTCHIITAVDFVMTCVFIIQASIWATFILNSSHSISSFKLNQNNKLYWQSAIFHFKVGYIETEISKEKVILCTRLVWCCRLLFKIIVRKSKGVI